MSDCKHASEAVEVTDQDEGEEDNELGVCHDCGAEVYRERGKDKPWNFGPWEEVFDWRADGPLGEEE